MLDFKTPMAVLKVESAVSGGNEFSGRRSIKQGSDSGTPTEERLFMAGRIGETIYLMARMRICCATDFCGGLQISTMDYIIKRKGDWTDIVTRKNGGDPIKWGDDAFMSLKDVTPYLGKVDMGNDDSLADYLYWSMANAVFAYARFLERTLVTCLDKSYTDHERNTYRNLLNNDIQTSPIIALMATMTDVHPRMYLASGCVGDGDPRRISALIPRRFTVKPEYNSVSFHNRNSGNTTACFMLTGSHGLFSGVRDEYGDMVEACTGGGWDGEDCGECDYCESNIDDGAWSVSIDDTEDMFFKAQELPFFRRSYWYNG